MTPLSDIDEICKLCHQFTSDLITFGFKAQQAYPDRWVKQPNGFYSDWNDAFYHHDTHAQLLESRGAGCSMCNVIATDFANSKESSAQCTGRLLLFPFTTAGRPEPRTFIACWDQSRGFLARWGRQHHLFFFGRRGQWDVGFATTSPEFQARFLRIHERDFIRAVASSSGGADALNTARFWLKDCQAAHPKCTRVVSQLPSRVIDVGSPPKLRITNGEMGQYIALSHCWGGNIPHKLIQKYMASYCHQLPVDLLPQNFQDAIVLTRELGLRYLWIDALCIIQDSEDDWKNEAIKMAEIYSSAVVTISTLNSDRSTTGFLRPRESGAALVSPEFAVQPYHGSLLDALEASALNTRGWCMQERLLSPALLHIGDAQLFWECRTGYGAETGSFDINHDRVGASLNYTTREFIRLRTRFVPHAWQGWQTWYDLVSEYTLRNLSFASDKFPALAGAARIFQHGATFRKDGDDDKKGATYIAGLWEQDLSTGLFWGALSKRLPAQKAAGFSECHNLSRPREGRAPSWSWGSVDGPVQFYGNGGKPGPGEFCVLDVNVSQKHGEADSLAQPVMQASIRLRARVARMFYYPPEHNDHVGSLRFSKDGPSVYSPCVMDFDRKTGREVTVLLSGGKTARCLMLQSVGEQAVFSRIGFGTAYYELSAEFLSHFSIKEVILV